MTDKPTAALPPHDHTIEPGEINRRGCERCRIDAEARSAASIHEEVLAFLAGKPDDDEVTVRWTMRGPLNSEIEVEHTMTAGEIRNRLVPDAS